MNRKEQAANAALDAAARVTALLDQMQSTIDHRRTLRNDERTQELQDSLDRRRFDHELKVLELRARYPKK